MPDVFLRSVPTDPDQDDPRLYDPTTPDGGGGTQDLFPGLFTDGQTFFSPQLNLNISLDLFSDPDTFFAAQLNLNLSPGLFTDPDTFFTHQLNLNINPDLYTDPDAFFAPHLALNLSPDLFSDPDTFPAPEVVQGAVTLSPDLFTNVSTVLEPTIVPGSVDLTPDLVVNSNIIFDHEVEADDGSQDLEMPLIGDTNTFFNVTVQLGDPFVATGRIVEQGIVPNSWITTWAALANGETGDMADIPMDAATRSVQVSGTFGAGGNVAMQGSNDGSNWAGLTSALGVTLATITTASINSIDQNVRFIRPVITAGDGTTNLRVVLVAV